MTLEERKQRVIARGEFSNHSHVITGDATIHVGVDGRLAIIVPEGGSATQRHLLETDWMLGIETWTGEHHDIPLAAGEYEFVQQSEYHPYLDKIVSVQD